MDAPAPPRQRDWWARPKVVLPFVGAHRLARRAAHAGAEPWVVSVTRDCRRTSRARSARAALARDRGVDSGTAWCRGTARAVPDSGVARGGTIHAVLAPPMEIDAAGGSRLPRARCAAATRCSTCSTVATHSPIRCTSPPRAAVACSACRRTTRPVAERCTRSCRRSGRTARCTCTDCSGSAGRAGARGIRAAIGPAGRWSHAVCGAGGRSSRSGAGRVVVVADPDLLRNDVLRRCSWGADVIAMRMLEWLRAGGTQPRSDARVRRVSPGLRASRVAACTWCASFLAGHPVGRTLLADRARRAGAAARRRAARRSRRVDRERVERRDPLEQVDALAHAYQQVRRDAHGNARACCAACARASSAPVRCTRAPPGRCLSRRRRRRARRSRRRRDAVRARLREPLPDRASFPSIGAALRRIEADPHHHSRMTTQHHRRAQGAELLDRVRTAVAHATSSDRTRPSHDALVAFLARGHVLDRGRARHGEDAARARARRGARACASRASSSRRISCRPTSPA